MRVELQERLCVAVLVNDRLKGYVVATESSLDWQAMEHRGGVFHFLGTFDDKETAVQALAS